MTDIVATTPGLYPLPDWAKDDLSHLKGHQKHDLISGDEGEEITAVYEEARDEVIGVQEDAGLDRIVRGSGRGGGQDGIFLVDADGETLLEEDRDPGGWLTIVEPMTGWDAADRDLILAYRRGGDTNPTLYDGQLNPVVTFPEDGDVAHADLAGTGREQVLIRWDGTVHVFGAQSETLAPDPEADPLPQPKRLATATLYPGGER